MAQQVEGLRPQRQHFIAALQRAFLHLNFCPTCGTTVAITFERWPEVCAISRGTFDDPNWVHVDAHIWARSAQEGTALHAGTHCYKRSLFTLAGTPEVPERFDAQVNLGGRKVA
jgi:hypothetical protein